MTVGGERHGGRATPQPGRGLAERAADRGAAKERGGHPGEDAESCPWWALTGHDRDLAANLPMSTAAAGDRRGPGGEPRLMPAG